jgi:hypothetical protein
VYPPFFGKLRSTSNPTNTNLPELGLVIQTAYLGNQSELDTS